MTPSEKNFQTFLAWVASQTDEQYRELSSRGVLSRTKIAEQCDFAKSALSQNPRIKAELKRIEDGLKARGVLPESSEKRESSIPAPLAYDGVPTMTGTDDKNRVHRLEVENANLRAELGETKRMLSQFTVMQDVLNQTGRLPR